MGKILEEVRTKRALSKAHQTHLVLDRNTGMWGCKCSCGQLLNSKFEIVKGKRIVLISEFGDAIEAGERHWQKMTGIVPERSRRKLTVA